MRGTHNPKWGIINIVCITTAVICVGVTVLGNFHNGAIVTSEVFLGVIGSLIGACATIIVGFQIFNYFEFKDVKSKTMKIEQLLNQASANNYKQEVLIRKSNNHLSNVFILLSREMKDADKINMYISSIVLESV